jgi:putative nucleotidyltransferase with HDIG domain
MAFFHTVLGSVEPLTQSLAKIHKVSIVIFDADSKALIEAGPESPLLTRGCAEMLWQQSRRTEDTLYDLILDGSYVSIKKILDANRNTCLLICMARTPESTINDKTIQELLDALSQTVQGCIQWDGTQRSTVVELMEKYEELTLLYDVSERLECLPSFDEVANEMLKEAIARVKCKAGRLVLTEEGGTYRERIFSSEAVPQSAISYRSEEDTAVCLKKPVTQIVNDPIASAHREMALTQLHVPIRLKENPIGMLSLFRTSNSPFKSSEKKIAEMLARQAAGKLESSRLYAKLESLFMASIKMLVECIDARDSYTSGHSTRVSIYSIYLAREIGLSEDQVRLIEIGALLHDVGKIRIRDNILNKPGRLTEEERNIIKDHPEFGKRIVEHVKQLQETVPCIYCHHEYFNGNGYPRGLGGEDIPLMGRIVTIADTFDAMTTTRPYRKALSQREAYEELLRYSGIQFDPHLAEIFAYAIQRGEFEEDRIPETAEKQI